MQSLKKDSDHTISCTSSAANISMATGPIRTIPVLIRARRLRVAVSTERIMQLVAAVLEILINVAAVTLGTGLLVVTVLRVKLNNHILK